MGLSTLRPHAWQGEAPSLVTAGVTAGGAVRDKASTEDRVGDWGLLYDDYDVRDKPLHAVTVPYRLGA